MAVEGPVSDGGDDAGEGWEGARVRAYGLEEVVVAEAVGVECALVGPGVEVVAYDLLLLVAGSLTKIGERET